MKLIMIHGESRHGKTSLADIIKNRYEDLNVPCVHVGNADAVWKIAREIYDWDDVKDDAGRKLSYDITETGYNYDEYFFERRSFKKMMEYYDIYPKSVILMSDWRYIRTYNFFKQVEENYSYSHSFNFKVQSTIRVFRPDFDNGYSPSNKSNKWENEKLHDFKFDYTFENRSLSELESNVLTYFKF